MIAVDTETSGELLFTAKHYPRLIGFASSPESYRYTTNFVGNKDRFNTPGETYWQWSTNYDAHVVDLAGFKIDISQWNDLKIPFKLYDERVDWTFENALIHCGIPNHKYLRKSWEAEGYTWATVGLPQLTEYNKLDVVRMFPLHDYIKGKYDETQNRFLQATNQALYKMRRYGIAFDQEFSHKIQAEFQTELEITESLLIELAGKEINWNSMREVAEVLESKGIKVPKTPKGNPSIKREFLETLPEDNEFSKLLVLKSKLLKRKSTYIDGYQESLGSDGLLHSDLGLNAKTWRFSSRNPNVQNTPRGDIVRRQIVSRFNNGILLSGDASQLEPRLIANVTQDKNMIDAYLAGRDIYQEMADKFGVTRYVAKQAFLAVCYWAQSWKLHKAFGFTLPQADQFRLMIYSMFPGIKVWHNNVERQVKETGKVVSLFGRIRRTDSPTEGTNTNIQTTGHDLNKMAMIRMQELREVYGFQSSLCLEVHDDLTHDIHPDEYKPYLDKVVRPVYNGILDEVERWFGRETRDMVKVPIKFELKQGPNLYSMEKVND